MRAWQVLGLALMLVAAPASHAQEAAPPAKTERSAMDFTHCWGGKKSCTHTDCRAGNAQDVAWYARSGESAAFVGYQVGGGSAFRGSCPGNDEGTWGDRKSVV